MQQQEICKEYVIGATVKKNKTHHKPMNDTNKFYKYPIWKRTNI